MNPEFECPTNKQAKAAVVETKQNTATAAVAEASGEGDAAVATMEGLGDDAGKEEWVWGPQGAETMHPFLAVRQMTRNQLAKEAADPKVRNMAPRFNCQIVQQVKTCVTVRVVKSTSVNTTRPCAVPFLTNVLDVEEGSELMVEVEDKEDIQPAPNVTWKQTLKL